MKVTVKKIESTLKSKFCFLAFLFLCSTSTNGQSIISFNNLSDKEVLEKVSSQLDIALNYNHDILKDAPHRFSASGSIAEIISVVERKLGFQFTVLDNNIYAINPLKIDAEHSEPTLLCKVKDEDGEHLSFCNIILPTLDIVLQSNIDGEALINGYYANEELVQFTYLGFESYNTSIGALRNNPLVTLKNASHVLGEITITDFLQAVSSNDLESIESLQNINLAGSADQDILVKAQLLPGIHSTSESLHDLQIRGGPPDQVSYKWNGIRLLQTNLFFGKVSGVNPFLVDEISITRNGASADHSGQASGSILLESSDRINNKFRLNVFSDFLYGNVGLDLPIVKDKLSAKIAYRRSHNYLIDTKMYNDYTDQIFQFGQLTDDQFYIDLFDIRGQERISKRFSFDDLSANINWQPTAKLNFETSFISIGNEFQYDYFDGNFTDEEKRDQIRISNLGYSIAGSYLMHKNLKLTSTYSGSNYQNHYLYLRDINQSFGEDRFKENDVVQDQIKLDLLYEHQKADINIGVQNENWEIAFVDTTRTASLGLLYVLDENATEERSAYAKVKWKFIRNTLIETGIRYSDFGFSLVDRKFVEPRLHFSHNLGRRLTLHAHFGKFHQNLNRRVFVTPLDVEKGIWYLSDERPESDNFIWVVQNTQSSIGLKYLISNWKFTIDAYTKKAENIWTSALDFAVEEDPFAFADLFAKGIEVSGFFQNKNWRLLWTYELTDETMNIKTEPEYEIKSPFVQKHKISLMQSYTQGAFTFTSRWRYNSGRRFSRGKSFVVETEPELFYGLEYESILEDQISPYHSLDASIEYQWNLKTRKKQKLTIGLHIQNLYNRKNVIKRQYFIDYTKTPFEMSFYDRKGIGFIPNISLKYQLL